MAASEVSDPSYTVFIRLPFPRGDFVDPPAVDWNAAKDKLLWKILSKASKNSDIDWNALAEKFDVTLPFLLQQAAWLYERQLSQVRAQMRKVGATKGPTPSATQIDGTNGEAMRRTGSGSGGPRAPSSMSTRKDSSIPRNDPSVPNTPIRTTAPPLSRTSSANTTVQSRHFLQNSPRPTRVTLHRLSISPPTKVLPSSQPTGESHPESKAKSPSSSEAAESSEPDSSDSEPARSRLVRPLRRFTTQKFGRSEDADDDDDAFLPFSTPVDAPSAHQDPSETLRGDLRQLPRRTTGRKSSTGAAQQSQTSDSSASSTAQIQQNYRNLRQMRPTGPISPRRTLELAGRSPANRGKGQGREGSDGTPSMGSSFSDLDDESVTQSALEEALASNMQQGGMASRMSTISQAIRSRYL